MPLVAEEAGLVVPGEIAVVDVDVLVLAGAEQLRQAGELGGPPSGVCIRYSKPGRLGKQAEAAHETPGNWDTRPSP